MIFSNYSYLTIPALITLGCGTYLYHLTHNPAESLTTEQLQCSLINENQLETKRYLILFAHGIDTNPSAYLTQAGSYAHILQCSALTFSFNDTLNRINLAQDTDLNCLERAYNCALQNYPHKKIVLIGISRGASTIIKFLAERQRPQVCCVILESPWDTIRNLTSHISNQYLRYIPGSAQILNALAHSLPNVKNDHNEVIDAVNQLSTTIPIHVIYSTADKVVPPHGTANVIEILQRNNQTVSSLCLSNGKHGKLSHIDECKQSITAFVQTHLN